MSVPGGYSDSIVITWYSDSTTVIAQQYSKCGSQVVSQNCPYSSQPIFSPTVGQWYHVALVFTPQGPTSTYNGTWTAYVNGGLAFTTQVVYPLPVYRQDSYIGGSDWTDAPISANFDAVRVYNYALQQTEVQGMANKYGLAAPPSGAQQSSSSGVPGIRLYGDTAAVALLSSYRAPVFSLNFSVSPASLPGMSGQTLAYQWQPTDPLDTSAAVSQYHTGVVILNAAPNSYVDLSSAASPNSAGYVMPVIGGANNTYSFEVVFKVPQPLNNSHGWPKLFLIGQHTHPTHSPTHPHCSPTQPATLRCCSLSAPSQPCLLAAHRRPRRRLTAVFGYV